MHTGQGLRVLSVSPARERLPKAAAAALEARPLPAAACVYAPCGCMCVRARARACVCVRAMQEHEDVLFRIISFYRTLLGLGAVGVLDGYGESAYY